MSTASPRGVSIFDAGNAPPEMAALQRLRAIATLPYVERPVVALPDLHWKPNLETPSSTATATESEIVLGFSSPSQNCGMTLLRTPLRVEDLERDGRLAGLMEALREEIPRSRKQPILTREEAIRLAMGGAVEAASQFGLDPNLLEGIEERGALFGTGGADRQEVLDALDEGCLDKGRYSFGFIGGGNHFLELQAVDEILEPEACRELGLEPGRLVIMYHTGSERFGHDLGRLYAVRLKTSRRRRRKYFLRKIPLHLMRGVRSPGQAARRWRYHFSKDNYIPVPADSTEGRRLAVSLKAAGNFGYANRVAVLDLIRRAIAKAAGGGGEEEYRIIADLSHNVVAREEIGGRDLWVHRHNSVRLRPPSAWPEGSLYHHIGQPSMLPGTNRSSSYLMLSREGAAEALHSVDHGAGRTVDRYIEDGLCRELPERRTMKFTYAEAGPEMITHVSDEGIDEVVSVLKRSDIAAPALRLRPLAVLKG